jgi:hypothetical protein
MIVEALPELVFTTMYVLHSDQSAMHCGNGRLARCCYLTDFSASAIIELACLG